MHNLSKLGFLCVTAIALSPLAAHGATTVPASFAVAESSVDKSKRGFNVQLHQLDFNRPGGNNLPAPLRQLNGEIIDPATGAPAENVIDNTGTFFTDETGKWTGAVFREEGTINYHEGARDNPDAGAGSARPDKPIPGVPGLTGSLNNIAMRATTYLELKKGVHRMGVNSDDGFVVAVSPHPLDTMPLILGIFDGGRGAADSLFEFEVAADGIYPFVFLWWEGTGGASVEWFSITDSGERVLINDPQNASAIKAFRESTAPLPPYVKSVSPAAGAFGVPVNANVEVVVVDAGTKLAPGSVQATVNGATAAATVSKTGDENKIVVDPATDLPSSATVDVRITFSDDATTPLTRTLQLEFTTERAPINLPPLRQTDLGLVVIEAENFDAHVPGTEHTWAFAKTPSGFTGEGTMYSWPDSGANLGMPDALTSSPRLEYKVQFVKTGKHYFWFRGSDGGGDSLHASVNDVDPTGTTLDNIDEGCCGDRALGGRTLVWVGGVDNTPEGRATFDVPSAGVHTIKIFMREDGQIVDKLLITTDANFVPSGTGPEGSRRVGDPVRPTVTLAAPADGATFAMGADVTITADANDPDGTVSQVEFFASGQKIGEDTTAPFSLTWKPAEERVYRLSAKATDNSGDFSTSAEVKIVVGTPQHVLYAGNNPDTHDGDQVIIRFLENRGFLVTTVDDNATDPMDLEGKSLVVISSTVNSGNVADKYTAATIPIINWEEALMDDLILTGNSGSDPDHHGTTGSQTALNIVKADHPLAAGLSAGVVDVHTAPATISWGFPDTNIDNAIVIAHVVGSPNQVAIFGYEKGAALFDGFTTAPARRVGFFLNGSSPTVLTPAGLDLVNAAINWALNITVVEPPKLTIARAGNNITVSWTGGGTLQQADSVLGPWTDVPGQQNPHTLAIAGTSKFFRIRR